jgi:hypothetical protein
MDVVERLSFDGKCSKSQVEAKAEEALKDAVYFFGRFPGFPVIQSIKMPS